MIWLWLVPALLLLAPVGLCLFFSFQVTHRHTLEQARSPAEVGLAFEEVAFPARDGLVLRGWWIPAPGADRAIISLHGQGGSMDPDLQYLPDWHVAGFHVLMFDFRAHGRSPGQVSTVGYLERQDAQGAVDFVRARGIERIGFLGFSMGGMVAMLSAPLCPEVGAVVSDGAPARLWTGLAGRGLEWGVPPWLARPLGWLTIALTSLRLRVNLFRYEPVRSVGRISPRPLLLIHGDRDPYVRPAEFEALLAAARPPVEVWRVPEAGHRTVDQLYPEEWRRRVVGFFDRYLC